MSVDCALTDSELLYLSSLASVLLKRDLNISPVSVFIEEFDCDIGNIVFAEEGDEVVLFGNDNKADLLAETIDSISYELLTAISQRVKRVFYRK